MIMLRSVIRFTNHAAGGIPDHKGDHHERVPMGLGILIEGSVHLQQLLIIEDADLLRGNILDLLVEM